MIVNPTATPPVSSLQSPVSITGVVTEYEKILSSVNAGSSLTNTVSREGGGGGG